MYMYDGWNGIYFFIKKNFNWNTFPSSTLICIEKHCFNFCFVVSHLLMIWTLKVHDHSGKLHAQHRSLSEGRGPSFEEADPYSYHKTFTGTMFENAGNNTVIDSDLKIHEWYLSTTKQNCFFIKQYINSLL